MKRKAADLESVGAELRAAITAFVVPLQTTREVDVGAFSRLESAARRLAEDLKGVELVPKALLNEVFVAANILRREAPYLGTSRESVAEMASKLEMVFSLILRDEVPGDRVPGVPRII